MLEFEDFAAHVDSDFLGQVAVGDGGGDGGDVAHLVGQVAGHEVDVIGEVLPGSRDAGDVGLAAELAFGAHFAGHAGHFGGEGAKLVHHRIDGVFQFENLTLHVDGDFLGQVAVGDGLGYVGDVAHLGGEIGSHEVGIVCEVLPGAGDAFHFGLAAELAFGTDFAGHAGYFVSEGAELVHHGVDGGFQFEDFALHVDGDFFGKIARGDGGGDGGDIAHLRGEVGGHGVHRVGEVFPGSGNAADFGLTAELSFGAHFAGHAGHFGSEGVQLVHHRVDGLLEFENFAFNLHGDFLGQVAVGDGGGHGGDVADLGGEVTGHGVHGVGEVFPRTGDAFDIGLAAQFTFGAHLAGHARHFGGKRAELVHHGVDDVFDLENFTAHVDGDLLRQVAIGDGRCDLGHVAELDGEVGGHGVHGVGEVFPDAGDALHFGLTAEFSFGADFAGHAGHFGGEGAELVDHRVDGVFQFENFALDVNGDFAREVAVGDGLGHVGDVAHLRGEIAGHHVDVIGEVLPGAGDALHVGLAAELSFGAHFAGHAGHFVGEGAELVHHRVDRGFEFLNFAFDVDGDFLRQVAVGDGGGHGGDVADLGGEVTGHGVHGVGEVFPGTGDAFHLGLTAEAAFRADFAGHAGHFRGEGAELVDHRVDGVFQFEDFAFDVDGDFLGKVASRDGGGHRGDVAHLGGEVTGHGVHGVGEVLPSAGDTFHFGLAAEFSFGTDFASHAGHFRGEGAKLVHHRVDGVFQFLDFAFHVHGDLLRQVAVGDGGGHGGDVAHLGGEVAGHGVHGVGEVLPRTGDAFDFGLAAELSFGADFAGHAGHFGGEGAELVDHRVDGSCGLEEFPGERAAFDFQRHALAEVALGDGAEHAAGFADGVDKIADEGVDGIDFAGPGAGDFTNAGALGDFAFFADDDAEAVEFVGHPLGKLQHVVENIGDFAVDAVEVDGEANGEVAFFEGKKGFEQMAFFKARLAFTVDGARGHSAARAGRGMAVAVAGNLPTNEFSGNRRGFSYGRVRAISVFHYGLSNSTPFDPQYEVLRMLNTFGRFPVSGFSEEDAWEIGLAVKSGAYGWIYGRGPDTAVRVARADAL